LTFFLNSREHQTLLNNHTLRVVDDEESIRHVLGYLLISLGYTIEFAVDARGTRFLDMSLISWVTVRPNCHPTPQLLGPVNLC